MPAFAVRRLLIVIPALLVATLALSLLSIGPAEAHRTVRERKIHHGLEVALRQKGDPYVYGADGPSAFDCSGLTEYAFGKAGLRLPRSSDAQGRFVRRIPKSHLRRGDFMFFDSGSGVYHVGLYLGHHGGHRYLLHAAHPGTVVQRDPVWTNDWYAGTLRHRS
ncbi:MAG: C40 family peptidase [Nocardioidaceae bacterium]